LEDTLFHWHSIKRKGFIMNALRFLPLLICALIAWHGSALAAIVPISQTRYVEASGYHIYLAGYDENGPVYKNIVEHQKVSAPDFGNFDASAYAHFAEATQQSLIGSTLISANGAASANGEFSMDFEYGGKATSYFNVQFQLTHLSIVWLSGTSSIWDDVTSSILISLKNPYDQTLFANTKSGPYSYTAVLPEGYYSLTAITDAWALVDYDGVADYELFFVGPRSRNPLRSLPSRWSGGSLLAASATRPAV
jgi:hypothetical protein